MSYQQVGELRAWAKSESVANKTMVPARVIEFVQNGNDEPYVNVLISVRKTKFIEGREKEYKDHQVIDEVPLAYLSTQSHAFTIPVKFGDTGYLIFSDGDLTEWYTNDEDVVDPDNQRIHSKTDVIFVPGLWKRPKGIGEYSETAITMRTIDNTSFVSVDETGVVELAALTELRFNAPIITVNGIPWETINPTTGMFSFADTITPGLGGLPAEVNRP